MEGEITRNEMSVVDETETKDFQKEDEEKLNSTTALTSGCFCGPESTASSEKMEL